MGSASKVARSGGANAIAIRLARSYQKRQKLHSVAIMVGMTGI